MLSPRLPLYICALYCSLTYVSSIAARRMALPPLAEAAAVGLCHCGLALR